MSTRSVLAILIAILFPLSLPAQGCPQQTTENVAASLTYGPQTECTGIDYKLGNVVISTTRSGCPTFAIYVPEHEIAVATNADTKVQVAGQSPITLIAFRCDKSYLIFIPLSSTCVVASTSTMGTVLRLITVSC